MTKSDSIIVSRSLLVRAVQLLNEMAGEGIFFPGYADPADLMMELSDYFDCADADDPLIEMLNKIKTIT